MGLHKSTENIECRTEIIEHHLHSNERWFEKAASANGELHVADRIGNGSGSFQIDAGNDDWGAWVQILGTNDTPVEVGETKFDSHRFQFVTAERNADYFVQVLKQNTNPNTQGIANTNEITEFVLRPLSNVLDADPLQIRMKRHLAGSKIWVRCICPGQDTGTLNFYPGIHEYNN